MRRAGLILVLLFLGTGTLMGQVPVPGTGTAVQGPATPKLSVMGGRTVIATTGTPTNVPPSRPQPQLVPVPTVEDVKVRPAPVKPDPKQPVPPPPKPTPPPVVGPAPRVMADPHSLAPAVMPIPSDGLDQISGPFRAAKPRSDARPTIVPVVAENKAPAPAPAQPTEPARPQPPGVLLHKTGPESHNVGKPFKYDILVRNPGTVALAKLRVVEQLPDGAKCLSVEPQAQNQGQALIWDLGSLEAGEEKKLTVEVDPVSEGEYQSTATAMIVTNPWQMRVTRPDLKVSVKGPAEALVGDEVPLEIQVTNPGSGQAVKVALHDHLPAGLQHPQGSDIEADLGNLAAGQTRSLTLKAKAVESGTFVTEVTATAEGNLEARDKAEIRIIQPGLKVKKTGPDVTYLHHELEHRLEVQNTGQAPATSVRLTDELPEGLEFLTASDGGFHDPKTRKVDWTIGTLAPGQSKTVTIQMRARQAGDWNNKAIARADRGLESTDSAPIHVEGVPAMLLEVVDLDDPLEVGAETEYEIRVINQGTSAVAGVGIRAVLPEGLELVRAEGPMKYRTSGKEVTFDPLDKLTAKADALYKVRVKARRPGDWRFQVYLVAKQLTRPVFEEESTQVYEDPRAVPLPAPAALEPAPAPGAKPMRP